ncbi:hypothetical protein A2U01_0071625, partial [Trifolium medium]|nr:hypothetical protein [Trifolium medium]
MVIQQLAAGCSAQVQCLN